MINVLSVSIVPMSKGLLRKNSKQQLLKHQLDHDTFNINFRKHLLFQRNLLNDFWARDDVNIHSKLLFSFNKLVEWISQLHEKKKNKNMKFLELILLASFFLVSSCDRDIFFGVWSPKAYREGIVKLLKIKIFWAKLIESIRENKNKQKKSSQAFFEQNYVWKNVSDFMSRHQW